MFAPFHKAAGYWGFDKVELNVSIQSINQNKLRERQGEHCRYVGTSLIDVTSAKPEDRFNTIRIFDSAFGEFYMSSGGGNPYAKCFRLVLVHGGINTETVGVLGLQQRFTKTKKVLAGYGIIIRDDPLIRSLELAFMLAADKRIPFEVLKVLLYILSQSTNISAETFANIGSSDEVHKLTSKKSKNCNNVIYNKGAQEKKRRQIAAYREDTIIYRFERTLMKNALNENEFINTCKLNDLTDSMFVDYINNMLNEAIDYYVKHILNESLYFYRKSLKAARLVSSQNYLTPLKDLLTAPLAMNYTEHVIDSETVVHANYNRIFPKKNIARAKRTILTSSLQKFDRLKNMHGWEVERLIAWMRFALKNTLGCPDCNAENNLKSFHVAEGQYSNKNEYLNTLIHLKRKYVHLDYAGLVRDRIDHHWRDFETKSLIK